jgi:hypothetical protein
LVARSPKCRSVISALCPPPHCSLHGTLTTTFRPKLVTVNDQFRGRLIPPDRRMRWSSRPSSPSPFYLVPVGGHGDLVSRCLAPRVLEQGWGRARRAALLSLRRPWGSRRGRCRTGGAMTPLAWSPQPRSCAHPIDFDPSQPSSIGSVDQVIC